MRDKRLATAVATLLAAFATAHLMQFGFSAGRALSGANGTPIGLATFVAGQAQGAVAALPEPPPALPRFSEAAATLPRPGLREIQRDAPLPPALWSEGGNGFGLPCDRALTADPAEGGRVLVQLRADCDPDVRVELRHEDLRFALRLAADGRVAAAVPALAADVVVEAQFADGTVLRARTFVPDAGRYERVALVADGWAGLSLRAFDPAMRTSHPVSSRIGAYDRLGDPDIDAPLLAVVYTVPAGRFGSLGPVRLDVEAEVTAANCARDVVGTVVRTAGGHPVSTDSLRVAMPSCTAVGDILVMELTPPDTRLAGN